MYGLSRYSTMDSHQYIITHEYITNDMPQQQIMNMI